MNNQLAQFFGGMTKEDIANKEYKVVPTLVPIAEVVPVDKGGAVEIPSFISKDYKAPAYIRTKAKSNYNIVVR